MNKLTLISVSFTLVSCQRVELLDDDAVGRTPPGPGAVGDNVSRVGGQWRVVCVELARLV